jgi:CBS domain-containing protein/anti-sigma regulatory factor (Ser/Thr protein kinase)
LGRDEKITKIQELVYEMKVEDVMHKNVITVQPTTRMSELREILRVNRISGTPVVQQESLVGVISIEDFIKWLADREEDCPIERKMTTEVKTLYADEPLVKAVNKLETSGFGRFPVIDRASGSLVGIITPGDIVEGLLKKLEIDYSEEEIHRYRASHIFEDILADRARLLFEYDVVAQDFERAGGGASGLKTTLRRLGIDPRIVRRVAIATYEAEMNVVVYSVGGRISCEVEPNKILVEVKDSGPGIADIEKAMQPGYSTAPEWVRELGFGAGMGLVNIKKCADEMDLTSVLGEGTSLHVCIYIS